MYDYSDRDSLTMKNKYLDNIQIGFTIVFTLEFILKVLAMGFVIKKHSYIRDGWNVLDFIVVICG